VAWTVSGEAVTGSKFRFTRIVQNSNILWHIAPLLCNDCKISNYTMAIARQRPIHSNTGMVFCVRSVQICYKQDKLGVAVSLRTDGVQSL
jgi:hypothetical protein